MQLLLVQGFSSIPKAIKCKSSIIFIYVGLVINLPKNVQT